MSTATLPLPPRETANPAPQRPRASVRRTSSIDVSWPDGEEGERLLIGRARDYRTPADGGTGEVIDQAEYRARLALDKTITAIEADPAPAALPQLVGVRAGNHLRLFVKEAMPELIAKVAPLYLVLDDMSGSSLVSAFAVSQWHENWAERLRERMPPGEFDKLMDSRVNICWGLKEGNSGTNPNGPSRDIAQADAGDVRNPADPQGWHDLPEAEGPGFRRARRIDLWREGGALKIDAAFQDSAKRKTTGRVAIHEYNVRVTADAQTLEIRSIEPEPRILPFWECPGAVANTQRLVGSRLSDTRDTVLAELRGTAGCTHLNDALRALADAPKLAEFL